MSFFATLQAQTHNEREHLVSNALVQNALLGTLDTDTYVAFLAQAYHHVKHTVPLLMAAGSRIPGRMEAALGLG